MNAIHIDSLSFSYGEEPILADVSLSLPESSFLALIGPNGGGKSTLLKLMVGLLRPDKGRVELLGKPLREGLSDVGYVAQDTGQLKHFPITVLDTAKMGFYRPGFRLSKKEAEKGAMAALELFGMKDSAYTRLGELSTGQRQRVMIARAVATKPRLLLMDEPISGVDPAGQEAVLAALKEQLTSSTVVFVSHNLSMIPGTATAVACVNRTLHYHPAGELTPSVLAHAYGDMVSYALVSHHCACGEEHEL